MVRGQLLDVGSLIPPAGARDQTLVTRLGGKYLIYWVILLTPDHKMAHTEWARQGAGSTSVCSGDWLSEESKSRDGVGWA